MSPLDMLQPQVVLPLLTPDLKEAREALCENERFKKAYNDFLNLLKKKAEQKDREDKDFFARLDYKAELAAYNERMNSLAAAKAKLQAHEDKLREEKAARAAEKEMKKFNEAMSASASDSTETKSESTSNLLQIKALIKQIENHQEKLTQLNSKIVALQTQLDNRSGFMAKVIQASGQMAANNLAVAMANNLNQFMKLDQLQQAALDAKDAKQVEAIESFKKKIQEEANELKRDNSAVLGNAPDPEQMFHQVKPLNDLREAEKQRLKIRNPQHPEAEIEKCAVGNVLGEKIAMLGQLKTVGRGIQRDSINKIKQHALDDKHLPETLKADIRQWQSIRMMAKMNESDSTFDAYSVMILDAFRLMIDCKALLADCNNERIQQEAQLKNSLQLLNELTKPSPREQSIDLRSSFSG